MKKLLVETTFPYYIILFVVFFVFFSYIHPLLPFDTDDWWYNGISRPPYPKLGLWNPTKVLPEILQPFMCMIAAYVIYPITGDYFQSLTLSNAFIVALFITIYFYSVHKILKKQFNVSNVLGFCIIIFYALLHFLILRIYKTNNDYLFYSRDVTCYYHYSIPNLFCCSLVLWLMRKNLDSIKSLWQWGILILVTYLAICSNLYSSVILIAYSGSILLIDLFAENKQQKIWCIKYIKSHYYYLSIIVFWLIIQIIEVNGERANSYGYLHLSFIESLRETIIRFIGIQYNPRFTRLTIFIIVVSLLTQLIYHGKKEKNLIKNYCIQIISLILSISYLILLSTKVKPEYIQKGDVIFPMLFFFFLFFINCFAYLCTKLKYIKTIIPLMCFIIFYDIHSVQNVFKDVQYWNGTTLQEARIFNKYIIDKVCQADATECDTLTIKVPWYNDYINWPLDYEHSHYVGITLYKHNIIKRPITTYFEVVKDDYTK